MHLHLRLLSSLMEYNTLIGLTLKQFSRIVLLAKNFDSNGVDEKAEHERRQFPCSQLDDSGR